MNWIGFSIITHICLAFMIILITVAIRDGASVPISLFVISVIWLPAFGIWSGIDGFNWPGYKPLIFLLVAGVLSVLGNYSQFQATSLAASCGQNVGYAIAVINSNIVTVTILSFLFIKSEFIPRKIFGVILTLVGIFVAVV